MNRSPTSTAGLRSGDGWGLRLLAFAFVLIVLGGAVFLVDRYAEGDRQRTYDAWGGRLQAMADDRKAAIEAWLGERRADAALIAGYPTIRTLVANLDRGPGPVPVEDGAVKHASALLTEAAQVLGYEHAYVVDRSGRVLVRAAGSPDPEAILALDGMVREPDGPGPRAVFFRDAEGRARLLFFSPVAGPSPGQSLGSVLLVRDPSIWMYRLLRREPTVTKTAETLLVRREGDSYVFLSPLRHHPAAPVTVVLPAVQPNIAAKPAVEGLKRFGRFVDYRDVPILAATRRIEGTKWGLVVKVDEAEAFEAYHSRFLLAGLAAAVAVAALLALAWIIWRTVAERHLRDLALRDERLRLLMDHAQDMVFFAAEGGRLLEANRAAEDELGFSADEFSAMTVSDLRAPEVRDRVGDEMVSAERPEGAVLETLFRKKDGGSLPVEVQARVVDHGGVRMRLAVVRNITARKAAEGRILQLNRLYRTLSEINQIIVRAEDEETLYADSCRILAEIGGFPLVWVGLKREGGAVETAAVAGSAAAYLEGIVVRWDGAAEGLGPVGRALRGETAVVIPDFAAEASFAPWRARAAACGLHSCGSFAVRRGGEVVAALMIYASTPGAIGGEERTLLEELAGDIGYALEGLRARDASRETSRALRESEFRFRQLFERMGTCVAVYEPVEDGRDFLIRDLNQAAERSSRVSRREVIGRPVTEVFPGVEAMGLLDVFRRVHRSGEPETHPVSAYHDERLSLWVENDVFRLPSGEIVSVYEDVTERVRAEEALRESERKYRELVENANSIILRWTPDGLIRFMNGYGLRFFGYSEEELRGRHVMGTIVPETESGGRDLGRLIDDLLRNPQAFEQNANENVKRNGERAWVAWTNKVVTDRQGNVVEILSIGTDITERKRSAEALRESEERFRTLFETMSEGMALHELVLDSEGRPVDYVLIDVNPSFEASVGLRRSESVGKRASVLFGTGEAPHLDLYAEVATTGVARRFQAFFAPMDKHFDISVMSPGKGRFATLFADITDRVRAESEIRRLYDEQRVLMETSPAGIILVDPAGVITFANSSMANLFGCSAKELVGSRYLEHMHPEQSSQAEKSMRDLIEGKRDSVSLERRYLRADGAEFWGHLSGRRLLNADGSLKALMGVITDITERVKAEEAVRLFQQLVQDSTDAIGMATPEGVHYYQNAAFDRLFGEIGDRDPKTVYADPGIAREVFATIMEGNEWRGEIEMFGADGVARQISLRAYAIKDREGNVKGLVGLHTDVTERKRAEAEVLRLNEELEARVAERTAQLQAANRELEAFSYSVSHDLRAPLRAIDGFAMAVEEDYGPKLDDEGRRLLGVVRRNTRKMGNLIDDLLAFSRAGRHEIAARLVDMELLAEGVFAELATERDRERVRFVRRPMPRAWGDQALLRQVWVNLIGNALKFSAPREAPLIEVGAVDGPEGPEYTVRDNGVGFDPAYADKLFGVFQRLHAERDFPGTGVGLALVQRIIQRHGGSVWAEGEVGKGAAFHFRLPARGGGRGGRGARKRSDHA